MPGIWVVGGRGMLGQAVVELLEAAGHAVLCTGRELDIAHRTEVLAYAAKHAPSHIINCAAYTKVDACETHQALALGANAHGPGHLGEAAAALGAPILHVSTDYVFDGTATTPYAEDAPCAPLGVYGRSKYAGEQALWAALEKPPTSASTRACGYVVRTSWLFGQGGPNFVTTMLRLMASKQSFGVVADQMGRPTYCVDLAHAILQLMGLGTSGRSGPRAAQGTYHFANSGAVSWHGFAMGILAQARALSLPLTCASIQAIGTADYPTPAQRPAYSVFSTDKVAGVLGQAPRSWVCALEAYLTQHVKDAPAADVLPGARTAPTPTQVTTR